jgi:predicted nucleic acid-binding protein
MYLFDTNVISELCRNRIEITRAQDEAKTAEIGAWLSPDA